MATYDENAECSGKYICTFVEATGEVSPSFENKTRELLEKHIGTLEPDGWYKLGDVAATFQQIRNELGPQTMEQGGEAAGRALPFPEDASFEDALKMLIGANCEVYRRSDMDYPGGTYIYEVNGRSARLGVNEAYPLTKPFAKGVYKSLIKRFGPENTTPDFNEVEPEENEQFAWEVTW